MKHQPRWPVASLLACAAALPAADWHAEARYAISSIPIVEDMPALTATIGNPGSNIGSTWLNKAWEPMTTRTKFYVSDGAGGDLLANHQDQVKKKEGFWDGASAEVFRLNDGVLERVRVGTIAAGGHLNSGWQPALHNKLVDSSTTNYRYLIKNWAREDAPYYFSVAAVDSNGRISALSNWQLAAVGDARHLSARQWRRRKQYGHRVDLAHWHLVDRFSRRYWRARCAQQSLRNS